MTPLWNILQKTLTLILKILTKTLQIVCQFGNYKKQLCHFVKILKKNIFIEKGNDFISQQIN